MYSEHDKMPISSCDVDTADCAQTAVCLYLRGSSSPFSFFDTTNPLLHNRGLPLSNFSYETNELRINSDGVSCW